MNTLCTWGAPLPETDRAVIDVNSNETFVGQWAELSVELQFTPRPPTRQEYAAVVSQFVYEYSIAHPELEIRYVEVMEGSPHQLKIQCISHTHNPFWAVIVAAIILIMTVVLPYIIPVAIASAIFLVGYALYKRLAPSAVSYQCPICGEEFSSYETLVAHMEALHPGAPIPDKPSTMPEWLPHILLAGVAAAAIFVIGKRRAK